MYMDLVNVGDGEAIIPAPERLGRFCIFDHFVYGTCLPPITLKWL